MSARTYHFHTYPFWLCHRFSHKSHSVPPNLSSMHPNPIPSRPFFLEAKGSYKFCIKNSLTLSSHTLISFTHLALPTSNSQPLSSSFSLFLSQPSHTRHVRPLLSNSLTRSLSLLFLHFIHYKISKKKPVEYWNPSHKGWEMMSIQDKHRI